MIYLTTHTTPAKGGGILKKTYAFDQVTRAIDETFGALLGEGEDE
ncbi:MAG TPA: hypothetical protein PKV93_14050 [Fervidobacterium sp.]|nr:hypothetical protein [Fervidobacterium sp.]